MHATERMASAAAAPITTASADAPASSDHQSSSSSSASSTSKLKGKSAAATPPAESQPLVLLPTLLTLPDLAHALIGEFLSHNDILIFSETNKSFHLGKLS